jgi:hypothetical protein
MGITATTAGAAQFFWGPDGAAGWRSRNNIAASGLYDNVIFWERADASVRRTRLGAN